MQKLRLLSIALLLLAVVACKPEAGDVGPQGTAGPTGAVGDKGPTGDKGPFSGTVSPWVEIKPSDWLPLGSTTNTYAFVLNNSSITPDVINRGLILVYYRPLPDDVTAAVIPLPDETPNYTASYLAYMSGATGSLQVNLAFRNAQTVNPKLEDWNIKVRTIVVPPATAGRLAAIDWKNYEEVKKAFNLTD